MPLTVSTHKPPSLAPFADLRYCPLASGLLDFVEQLQLAACLHLLKLNALLLEGALGLHAEWAACSTRLSSMQAHHVKPANSMLGGPVVVMTVTAAFWEVCGAIAHTSSFLLLMPLSANPWHPLLIELRAPHRLI